MTQPRGLSRIALAIAFGSVALAARVPRAVEQDRPTFRAGTEIIAVDVQVVDGSGAPILGLGPDKFDVSINRKRRRVVSATLLRFDNIVGSPVVERFESSGSAPRRVSVPPASDRPEEGRVFVLAVDTMSFRASGSHDLMAAARTFIETLQPSDLVGVFPFPLDAATDLTTDHAAVIARLEKVVGRRDPHTANGGDCYLNPSDIADFTSPRAPSPLNSGTPDPLIVRRVAEIASTSSVTCRPVEDAKVMAMMEEVEVAVRLNSLRAMLDALSASPQRKTVVLLSAGIISSDRPGGRPDVGVDLGAIVGQDAARANATIYTLWVDTRREIGSASRPGPPRVLDNPMRDARLLSAPLERITAASGGTMFNVIQGGGEFAFDRILRETSAYYLLGIEPDTSDRDGRARELSVKVNTGQKSVSVRARSWVVVPQPGSSPPAVARAAAPPASPGASTSATPVVPPTSEAAPAAERNRLRVINPATPTAATAPSKPVPPPDPTLEPILSSAATYAARFAEVFTNVIGEERYTQNIISGGSLLSRGPSATIGPAYRELRSDFLLVKTGGPYEWVSFRDVFEVNGTPVRDRDERLVKLFAQPEASAIDQAARIAREGARFNIGVVDRTINTPVLPLLFLQPAVQPRFRFSRGVRTPDFSEGVMVIAYQEISRPTLIRTVQDTDRLASGRLWIEAGTGRVLQSELVLLGTGFDARFTTLFRMDERLGIAVPVRMNEEYALASYRLVGSATYDNFHRFDVQTETKMAQPK